MRRILSAVGLVLLLVLVAWWVFRDRRKDEIPTQRLDPKALPQPVHDASPY